MRLRFAWTLLAPVALLAVFACEPPIPSFGYPGGCDEDAGPCGIHTSGGGTGSGTGTGGSTSSSTGTGAGAGGSTGASELSGTVALITSECFNMGTTFNGVANVVVQPSAGNPVTQGIGGMNAMSFDVTGVSGSSAWILVQDTSMGGAGIFSTYSFWTLPQGPGIQVPVIDSGMFTSIASSIPTLAQQGGISTSASHVVMQVSHAGSPYVGIAATGGFGSATVAYDEGGCTYSDQDSKTGTGGTIILFNTGLSGAANITLTDTSSMQNFTVPIFTGSGAVTLVAVDL